VLTHILSYSYLDLAAIWALSRQVQARVGVTNVFDKDPPFIALEVAGAAGDLDTFPAYDILGRCIFPRTPRDDLNSCDRKGSRDACCTAADCSASPVELARPSFAVIPGKGRRWVAPQSFR